MNQAGGGVFQFDCRLQGAETQADVGRVRRPRERDGKAGRFLDSSFNCPISPLTPLFIPIVEMAFSGARCQATSCPNRRDPRPYPTLATIRAPGSSWREDLASWQPGRHVIEQGEVGRQAAEPALPPGMPAALFRNSASVFTDV